MQSEDTIRQVRWLEEVIDFDTVVELNCEEAQTCLNAVQYVLGSAASVAVHREA